MRVAKWGNSAHHTVQFVGGSIRISGLVRVGVRRGAPEQLNSGRCDRWRGLPLKIVLARWITVSSS